MFNLILLVLIVKLDLIITENSDEVHFRPTLRRPASFLACSTPNDKQGNCIELTSCSTLYNLMITRSKEPSVVSFLRKSQCGVTYNKTPKVCCPLYDQGPLFNQNTTVPKNPQRPNSYTNSDTFECGKTLRKNTAKIVGGVNASLGDWPWMAALGYKSYYPSNRPEFKCGATLISDRWVLTAAHCVKNLGAYDLTIVRLGDLDLNPHVQDYAYPIDSEVEKIIVHPNYSVAPILNDITLLKLKSSVKFSKYIRPICLLSGPEFRSDTFYHRKKPFVIGWGTIAWRGPTVTKLQETSIPMVDPTKCANAYRTIKNARIDETILCAGEPGKDTCQGDSGGPLIFPIKEADTSYKFYLGGIISYGIRCADPNFPGVYTRIAVFTDWIRETTGLKL